MEKRKVVIKYKVCKVEIKNFFTKVSNLWKQTKYVKEKKCEITRHGENLRRVQKDEGMSTQNSLENRQHLSENRRENTRKHVALSVYRE